MNSSLSCPCCSSSMLLHLSNRRSYWLCSHCRLEMPDTDKVSNNRLKSTASFNTPVFKKAIVSCAESHQVAAI